MRPICLLLSAVLFLAYPAPAQKSKGRAAAGMGQDYVLALSTANHFLYAWATRNEADGLDMLSPKLKNKFPEEYLRSYISGVENPHHQAFEIGRGQRMPSGAFSFPVAMFEHYTGQKETNEHPKPLRIVVIQSGPESWLVDELPGFVAPEPKEP